jgi:hypothetical protein
MRPPRPMTAKRKAAAERARKLIERKMASVSARPELLPDREIARLHRGLLIALELNQRGLPAKANEILQRLIGPLPSSHRQRRGAPPDESA